MGSFDRVVSIFLLVLFPMTSKTKSGSNISQLPIRMSLAWIRLDDKLYATNWENSQQDMKLFPDEFLINDILLHMSSINLDKLNFKFYKF